MKKTTGELTTIDGEPIIFVTNTSTRVNITLELPNQVPQNVETAMLLKASIVRLLNGTPERRGRRDSSSPLVALFFAVEGSTKQVLINVALANEEKVRNFGNCAVCIILDSNTYCLNNVGEEPCPITKPEIVFGENTGNKPMSAGAAGGISVLIVLLFLAIVFMVLFMYRRKKKNLEETKDAHDSTDSFSNPLYDAMDGTQGHSSYMDVSSTLPEATEKDVSSSEALYESIVDVSKPHYMDVNPPKTEKLGQHHVNPTYAAVTPENKSDSHEYRGFPPLCDSSHQDNDFSEQDVTYDYAMNPNSETSKLETTAGMIVNPTYHTTEPTIFSVPVTTTEYLDVDPDTDGVSNISVECSASTSVTSAPMRQRTKFTDDVHPEYEAIASMQIQRPESMLYDVVADDNDAC